MIAWGVDPVLISIGGLDIRYYGVFFSASLMLGYFLATKLFKERGFSLESLDKLIVFLVIGLIVGARFGHIVFYELDYYMQNPSHILKFWEGGLASHGATIGTLTAYVLFFWSEKRKNAEIRFFDYADVIAICACLPASLVRLGNFFNSELVGRESSLPWATVFTRVDDLARHPSQLYEFLMGITLFCIMLFLWRKYSKIKASGFFFGVFFMMYFAMRFCVEFFKEFPLHDGFFMLTTGQILSIPFFVLGLLVFIKTNKKLSA